MIDFSTIRDKDEDYWDAYKGTPKAFIGLRATTGLRLSGRIDAEPLATLRTLQVFVDAIERRRHRPGRYDKRLGNEGADEEGQHEGDGERLDCLPRRMVGRG